LPPPTFLTAWTVSAGTKKTSPASTGVGGAGPQLDTRATFEDMDDLFARMLVLEGRRFGLISTRFWTTSRPGALRSWC
jgi:hypothetical protein